MAKQINDHPLDICFSNCRLSNLNIRTTEFFVNNCITEVVNTLSCEHEDICKMWHKKIQEIREDNVYDFWMNLQEKENPTFVEELLINYHILFTMIGEVCVEESKQHRTSALAIEDIRQHLNKMPNPQTIFERRKRND